MSDFMLYKFTLTLDYTEDNKMKAIAFLLFVGAIIFGLFAILAPIFDFIGRVITSGLS